MAGILERIIKTGSEMSRLLWKIGRSVTYILAARVDHTPNP